MPQVAPGVTALPVRSIPHPKHGQKGGGSAEARRRDDQVLSGWVRGAEQYDAQFVSNTGKRAYIKTEVFYCPAMVFSSSQDISYFSFSGHTRRRGSSLCGVRVMSSRVSRASTWSAYTHALPLCRPALCMGRCGRSW